MTGLELRSALAFAQAELTILGDNARALDELHVEGCIEQAAEQLREAFDRLQTYVQMAGNQQSSWFGKVGEATPDGV